MNDFMLIHSLEKGNLGAPKFLEFFSPPDYLLRITLHITLGLLLLNFGINKCYQRENRR